MRRDVLIHAIERIVADIARSGVADVFQAAMSGRQAGRETAPEWFSLEAFQRFSVASSAYGEAELEVLRKLELERLIDAAFWQSLIREVDNSQIYDTYSNIRFSLKYLPKLVTLLTRDYPDPSSFSEETAPAAFRGKALLRLILAEDESQLSSTERIILALESIQGIYDVLTEINGLEQGKLLVLGIDSGSDKLFDFLGIAQSLTETKELILGLFDRIVFRSHTVVSKNIAALAESLPVYSQISELEHSKKISPEHAELLRRKLTGSLCKFVDSGALIPEMDQSSAPDPRLVMRPEPKLLAAPADVKSDASNVDATAYEGTDDRSAESAEGPFTPEETEYLRKLLSERGRQGTTKRGRAARSKATSERSSKK